MLKHLGLGSGVAALLLLAVGARDVNGDLITYTVNSTVGAFDAGDPLGLVGSSITLVFGIDTTVLTPDFDGVVPQADQGTAWPDTNTTISLTISGSTSGDGTYAGTLTGGDKFTFFDNGNNTFGSFDGTDVVQFPNSSFSVTGQDVGIGSLIVAQDETFNTPSGPIQAYSFSTTDVTQLQDAILVYGSGVAEHSTGSTSNTSASAVPEPSAFFYGGLISVLAGCGYHIRRRLAVA